jgi:hypothetical protein
MFVPGNKWGELIKRQEGKYQRIVEKGWKTDVGFNGVSIDVGYGTQPLKVFPDPNCPSNTAYALKLDDWALFSPGEVVQNDLQHGAGLDMATSSGVEYRYVSDLVFATTTPKHNIVFSW